MTFATFGLVVSLAIASVHTSLAHGGNLRIINGWVDKFPIPSDIIWDGRVLANSTLKNFDTYTSKYDPTYVHGNALPNSSMSDFLYLPSYTTNHTSLFGFSPYTTPIGVIINENSVFENQTGYLRTELCPITKFPKEMNDQATEGITTFHFSIHPDSISPLDVGGAQYNLAFIQSGDYKFNIWTLMVGHQAGYGSNDTLDNSLRLVSSNEHQVEKILYSVDWAQDKWYNFAITVDWDNNKLDAYTSFNHHSLVKVVSGESIQAPAKPPKGRIHIGVQKVQPGETTVQYGGIEEGILLDGLFVKKGAAALNYTSHLKVQRNTTSHLYF